MDMGLNLDDLLSGGDINAPCTVAALKKVLALQIGEEMRAQRLTKTLMAKRMHTSRAALSRLLDERDTGLTLATLAAAAAALGKTIKIELVPAET